MLYYYYLTPFRKGIIRFPKKPRVANFLSVNHNDYMAETYKNTQTLSVYLLS